MLRAEHLEALLDHNPSLVFLKDEAGRYVYLNKAYEDAFVHSSDWDGKTDYDFWPKESADLFRENDAEVLRSECVHQFTEDSLDREGTRHVWVTYKFPLTDSEGRRYTGGIGIDATRMVEAEEALRESERTSAFLAEILKSVRDPLWAVDSDMRVTYWSDAAEQMFGWSAEEVMGQDTGELFQTIVPQSSRDAALAQTLEEGEFFGEVNVRRKDGSRADVEASSRALRGPKGDIAGLVITVRDITERRRVNEELRRSEAEARQLVRYAPTGIYQIDFRTKRFISVNEAMVALTGYSRDELLAMDATQILAPESQRLSAERLQRMLSGEPQSEEVEYAVRKKDGSEIVVVLNVSFELDEDGLPEQALVIGHDVTERRRQEEERVGLLESQRIRRRRIEALHDVVKVGLASVDVHSAAQRILDHLAGHYDFDLSSIWMRVGEALERVAQVGYPPTYLSSLPLSGVYDASEVFRAGHSLLVREPTNEAVLEVYRTIGIHLDSYMVLPLKARGHNIGVLNLVWTKAHELNDYDVAFFESVADEVAVVLENARLYEVEHKIAETLQETLVVLPSDVPGVEFARAYLSATYQPGWVGGDFVDLFHIDQHEIGVVIGDVSGKGTEAAVMNSLVRNTLRAYALDGFSPGQICEKTNSVTHRFTDTEAFVTLFFGILDTRTGSLRYTAAGHPPALIVYGSGAVSELPVSGNAMIGAFEQIACSEQEFVLRRGDRLLLYTDGVIEARLSGSDELFGEERLQAAVEAHADEPTSQLPQALMDEVVAFSDGVLRDDAAILVVGLQPSDGGAA
jgi:PAS domain S-box-containing protein